jgi:hypothetical protein
MIGLSGCLQEGVYSAGLLSAVSIILARDSI